MVLRREQRTYPDWLVEAMGINGQTLQDMSLFNDVHGKLAIHILIALHFAGLPFRNNP